MLNEVRLIGYVGKDPEVRNTQDGRTVASFSVATTERWVDKSGQRQERTEWHQITAWGRVAEIVREYVAKGRLLYAEGRLKTDTWEDKQGNTRRQTKVEARRVLLLGKGEKPKTMTVDEAVGRTAGEDDDDVPF